MSSFVGDLVRVCTLGGDFRIFGFPAPVFQHFPLFQAILDNYENYRGGFAIVWDGCHECDERDPKALRNYYTTSQKVRVHTTSSPGIILQS